MIKAKQHPEVKFPEGAELARTLHHGDRIIIARYSGYSVVTVREMFAGKRRMSDDVTRGYIRLMKERQELKNEKREITSQQNN